MNKRIVIAGSIAHSPGRGGLTWVFLQYLRGLFRLGFEVLFVDWIEPTMCVDRHGAPCAVEQSWTLQYFLDVMKRMSLTSRFALLGRDGEVLAGLPRSEILSQSRDSAMILNVMGFLNDGPILAAAPLRVFLDIDPGFPQMWREQELADVFIGHDAFVTIGENIGQPHCTIPTCGIDWITTPQPVVLADWFAAASGGEAFTSVVSWRGPFGPLEHDGRQHGLRVHEFRKFVDLPRWAHAKFELALDIDPADDKDRIALMEHGWRLVDPLVVAGDPSSYQNYIRSSRAEFLVAKNMYVETRSGWISDRSLCYLASGKPVLMQDTDLGSRYPTGTGLLTYRTVDEAAEGVARINRDYLDHVQAARRMAEEHFDSDKVLTRLLLRLGVKP
jgi:hypothetical protein